MPVEQADQLATFVCEVGHGIQPVGRAGRTSDIGEAVVMLMSDAGSFITGTHFVIDGGITMGPRHAWDPSVVSPLAALLGFVDNGQT
jgi:NAD(P)-dependent dehydrogenase (short-subunit alcohol dehydrogenase family)